MYRSSVEAGSKCSIVGTLVGITAPAGSTAGTKPPVIVDATTTAALTTGRFCRIPTPSRSRLRHPHTHTHTHLSRDRAAPYETHRHDLRNEHHNVIGSGRSHLTIHFCIGGWPDLMGMYTLGSTPCSAKRLWVRSTSSPSVSAGIGPIDFSTRWSAGFEPSPAVHRKIFTNAPANSRCRACHRAQ